MVVEGKKGKEKMTEQTQENIESELAHYIGSQNYYKTMSPNVVHTDGIKALADLCGAYWLIDAIVSHQSECNKDEMLQFMQFWSIETKDNQAVLTCERDSDDIAITQEIEYTDFPLDKISIWVENGVMILPSEH